MRDMDEEGGEMFTRCKYLSTLKNIAHCQYREETRKRAIENEKWNKLHGKYILTEYVEPDCPDDALRNEKGQNACWIVEVEE